MKLRENKAVFWIILTTLALMLSSFLLRFIENYTVEFKINPVFTGGKERVAYDILLAMAVYFLHIIPLAVWWNAIRARILQKGVRFFLLCIHGIFLFFVCLNFLQLILFDMDLYLLRVSGYIWGNMATLPSLLAFYAALCVGRDENYFPSKWWYSLLIIACILCAFMVSNEFHHLYFMSGGEKINFIFIPNIIFYIAAVWMALFQILKIGRILWVGNIVKGNNLLKRTPFFLVFLGFTYLAMQISHNFVWKEELFENAFFSAFLEVLIWEACIQSGLVQANLRHKEVFLNSNLNLQILDKSGNVKYSSIYAKKPGREVLDILFREGMYESINGFSMYLKTFREGSLIWSIDNTELLNLHKALLNIKNQLVEEVELMHLENQSKAEHRSIIRQSALFEEISKRLNDKINLLSELLINCKADNERYIILKKMSILTVYCKRYVNFFMFKLQEEDITVEELQICIDEIIGVLTDFGIGALGKFYGKGVLDSEYVLSCLEFWAKIMEYSDYQLNDIEFELIVNKSKKRFRISISPPLEDFGIELYNINIPSKFSASQSIYNGMQEFILVSNI